MNKKKKRKETKSQPLSSHAQHVTKTNCMVPPTCGNQPMSVNGEKLTPNVTLKLPIALLTGKGKALGKTPINFLPTTRIGTQDPEYLTTVIPRLGHRWHKQM